MGIHPTCLSGVARSHISLTRNQSPGRPATIRSTPADDISECSSLLLHDTDNGLLKAFRPEQGCICSSSDANGVCSDCIPASIGPHHVSYKALDAPAGCERTGHSHAETLRGLEAGFDDRWLDYDETLGQCPPELEIDDDVHETASLSSSTTAEDSAAAGCISQRSHHIPTRDVEHQCDTQAQNYKEVWVGWDDCIPRWVPNSEITYVLCTETFPPLFAPLVEIAMKDAIAAWQGKGVSFKQVPRDAEATFAVRYQSGVRRRAYAHSFFPGESPPELLVYEPSCSQIEYLPNILAHELGHILGLRHEFANEKERDKPSFLIGDEDGCSIMRYDKLQHLRVSERDLKGLERFYAYDEAEYKGAPIVDVKPHAQTFPEGRISNHEAKEPGRRFSC